MGSYPERGRPETRPPKTEKGPTRARGAPVPAALSEASFLAPVSAWVSVAALAWASASGCGAPAPPPEAGPLSRDLAADLAVADIGIETPRLRLADPSHRMRLGRGWGRVEEDDSGPYVWAQGPRSEVELFVAEPRDLELVIHGRPFAAAEAPEQRWTLSVEPPPETGRPAKPVQVASGVSLDAAAERHVFSVPSSALAHGSHRLILEPSTVYRPKDWIPGSVDDRPLSLQVYSLEILGALAAESPRRSAAPGSDAADAVAGRRSDPRPDQLEIPVGAGATWFLAVEGGERLVVRVSETSTADLRLEVDPIPFPEDRFGSSGSHRSNGPAAEGRFPVEARYLEPGGALDLPLPAGSLVRLSAQALPRSAWWRIWGAGPRSGRAALTAFGLAAGGQTGGGSPATAGVPASPRPAQGGETAGSEADEAPPRPDLLVYLVDTLRADRLGVYGYPLPTSPNLDRFARDAVVFTEGRAQTSWTRTAVVSIFTGLLPQTHGVNDREDALADEGITTLAEALWHSGYRTGGVVTNGNAGPRFGLAQGFEVYRHLMESHRRRDVHHLADRLHAWIGDWLSSLPEVDAGGDRPPFFLYAHATDPHAPYTPHEPWRSRFAAEVDPALGELEQVRRLVSRDWAPMALPTTDGDRPTDTHLRWPDVDPESARLGEALGRLYDAEIAFWDHHFGLLIEDLKRRGLYEDMAILVLSDHGEEFFEHGGWEHGRTLYEEQLHVPFLLKLPGGRGGGLRLDGPADQVDVLPTLLELAGIELPAGPGGEPGVELDGHSLLPGIERALAPSTGSTPPLFRSSAYLGLGELRQQSLVRGELKWIGRSEGGESLFLRPDRRFDEDRNLAVDQPWVAGWLRQEARRIELRSASRGRVAEHAEIDPELRKQLEALGYLQ